MSWRTGTRRLFPYLLVAAVGFVAAYLIVFYFMFPSTLVPTDVRTPNVVGQMYETATARLESAGFHAERGEKHFHATLAAGTVLRQDPEPGALRPKGTSVTLDVSAGQRTAEVPNVVGALRQRAEVDLQNVGLDLGPVRMQKGDAARGVVLAVDPAPGTAVALPATVTLTVSDGPESVLVPDLTGRTAVEARTTLRDAGLRLVEPPDVDTASLGTPGAVVRQSPAAGVALPPLSAVRVTISPPEPLPAPAPLPPPTQSPPATQLP